MLKSAAQQLYYSAPESGVEQLMKYESIGRVGKNILLSRERKRKQIISVFANDMSLIRENEMSLLPKDLLDVDFINTGDKAIIFYQYLEKSNLYLASIHIDENGKIINDIVIHDSTHIENIAEFPLFQIISNSAKTFFTFLLMDNSNEQMTKINSSLYNSKMQIIERADLIISTPNGTEKLSQFQLDNEGNLFFVRSEIGDATGNISRSDILIKSKGSNQIKDATIQFNKIGIKEIKTAIDHVNNKIIVAAIFFGGKKMNAQGIFSMLVDAKTGSVSNWHQEFFSDSLRKELKVKHTPFIRTFDDYYLDQVIPYTNGGFTLIIEQRFTEGNRGIVSENRSFISEPLPPRVVYNGNSSEGALFSIIRNPYEAFQIPIETSSRSYARNVAGNLLVLSMDNQSQIINAQIVRKEQDEVRSSHTISYTTIKNLNGIRFIYNEKEKNELSLRSASFFPDARIKRYPAAKGTVPNMRLLPRYATQIGPNECIMPAVKSSIGSFVRVVF
ncbi:MAG: hypothetical protein ACK5B8_01730 [Bacteroidota bacterium]